MIPRRDSGEIICSEHSLFVVSGDKMGRSFARDHKYRGFVSQQMWHDKNTPSKPYKATCIA
jgi:hypothetical protein